MPDKFFHIWVMERGCSWEYVQSGWNLDGIAEMTAAHRNAPVFTWVWTATSVYTNTGAWSSHVVDAWRADAIGCRGRV